ncbi:MAG: hypothetical protein CML06_09575 [Pseudomonadales bacterium]|nr:hypothetical protein [Pseudomonadales bacterium]
MKISTAIPQTPLRTGANNRDDVRLPAPQESGRERSQAGGGQPPAAEVAISEAARQAASGQQVVAANRGESVEDRYQYYRNTEARELPSFSQRALQAYSSTQQAAREAQGSGEYLSSIDLFV